MPAGSQVSNPAGVPSTKLDALIGMLGEIVADGHPVLVFSQFTGSSRRQPPEQVRPVSSTAIWPAALASERR